MFDAATAALIFGAVALVVVLVIASPHVQLEGLDVPILVVALDHRPADELPVHQVQGVSEADVARPLRR